MGVSNQWTAWILHWNVGLDWLIGMWEWNFINALFSYSLVTARKLSQADNSL